MDLIERQAAIDAIDEIESEVADGDGFQYEKWRRYFCELPSAQPNLQPTSNQLATDTISRQAIINSFRYDDDGTAWDMDDIVYRLEQFPSVTPDHCDTCRFVYYPKEASNNDQ